MGNFYAALEIGTSRTVLAIAEATADRRLHVTCHAEIPSTGVRKSQILSIPDATQSIRSVLREIERRQDEQGSKVTIANAYLLVSGPHVIAAHAEGQTMVGGGRVRAEDLDLAAQRAQGIPLPKGRELLDIAEQDYVLDNRGGLSDPKGMSGEILKLNVLQICASENCIKDARSAAADAHLEIAEPLFATTCAAEAVLDEHERRNGVLVLDLGGGSTGYAAYTDGVLATAGVIGVGGDHITNDIASAFQTTNAQAEELKLTEASAELQTYTSENARVHIAGSSALMDNRTISRRALDTVVNARAKEILSMIREILDDTDLANRLHGGCVLVGGGAALRNFEPLVEKELGLTVRRGRPMSIVGFEKESEPWRFAAVAGALTEAQHADGDASLFGGLFRRIFR